MSDHWITVCKSGKQHKTCSSALCTMDDESFFLVIRLGPKTSECEKNVTAVSTVTGCEVTNCAATLHGFNKHASSRREAVSVSRGALRCTENSTNLRLLTCVDRSTRPIHHTFCLQLVFITRFRRASCQENSSRSALSPYQAWISVSRIVRVPAPRSPYHSGSHQS